MATGSGGSDSVLAQYLGVGVVAALAATALLHILLLTTPRPFAFFGWMMTLVTVSGVGARSIARPRPN